MVTKVKFSKINYFTLSVYIIIFASILFYSINSLTFGEFPYVKKLINGRYIVISSIGIAFLDENLSNESNNEDFDTGIIYNEVSFKSTCIEQFDDGYIIVFFKTTLFNIYIFSSYENLISKIQNISLDENRDTYSYYSIIPYGHSANDYYFSLIFLVGPRVTSKLKIMKGTFNSTSNNISFQSLFELDAGLSYSQFSFSCILMNYNDNEKVINCIYENNGFACTNIFPNKNFSYNKCPINSLNTITKNNYFKSLVLPGKEESLLCSYNFHILNCFKYNILTNETINIINILEIREYSF